MSIRFRLEKTGLYRMINTLLWLGIGLFGAGSYWGIVSCGWLHIGVAIFVVILLTAFYGLSGRGRFLAVLGCLGCLAAFGVLWGFTNVSVFGTSYVRWLFGRPLWQEEWLAGYELLQVLWMAIAAYFLQILLEKDFRIKGGATLLVVAWQGYCLVAEKEMSRIAVALVLCYVVMVVTEWTQRHWKKKKRKEVQAYVLWLTPFFTIYLIGLLCMPVPDKPYDWKAFKEIYLQVKDSVVTISKNVFRSGREEYDLGLSGFSERGTLGAGFVKDEREIMHVQADKGMRTNLYLVGKVYDTFEGIQWDRQSQSYPGERYLDTVETVYALRRYDSEYFQDYLDRTELQVRYLDFKSAYMFAPLKLWNLENAEKSVRFQEKDGSILFDKKRGYGTEYEVLYYQMNLRQEAFDEFLASKSEPDEQMLEEIMLSLKLGTGEEYTVEDFENRREAIYRTYGEKVRLSAEVQDYLEQITQGAETPVERLRAIEVALSELKYHSQPGSLPEWVEDESTFLDYFLLESKQGYCSHFATAFVLLARAEGFPARYVQGYCVPMHKSKETIVTSKMAHAWPEVYLEGIGWIPFEPTPGYAKYRYTPWAMNREDDTFSSDAGNRYGMKGQRPEEQKEEMPEIEEETEVVSSSYDWGYVLGIVGMIFGMAMVLGVLLLWLERTVQRYRYRKWDVQRKYIFEIHNTLRILAGLGIERSTGETLEELQKRLNGTLGQEATFGFLEDYEAFLYGKQMVDSEMLRDMKREQERLLQILKKQKPLQFWYYGIFT